MSDNTEPKTRTILRNGMLEENPVLRQMLGLCPALAVTTAVVNAIGMGIATTFVLVCSGIVVSLLRKLIPDVVRLPVYITIIAAFVTFIMMIAEAFFPDINEALGIYLPLIVVNCIVLGRAEVFASKHSVRAAAVDGLGMGLGFTGALILMGAIREVLGSGTIFGFSFLPSFIEPMSVFTTPPGGFAILGVLIAATVATQAWRNPKGAAVALAKDCGGCSAREVCEGGEEK